MKKSISKVILAVGLSMSLLVSTMWQETLAYKVSTSGTKDIRSEPAGFQKARNNPMYKSKTQTINGSIAKTYQQEIFHYECQEGGYYAFYTTGGLDTVGALYEEENNLFGTVTEYKFRDKNDDKYSGVNNFGIVAKLDKYEDYFVCVRGYGAKTGSYTLKIEPNEDKISHKNYGVWDSKYAPASAINSKVWVQKKIYLN